MLRSLVHDAWSRYGALLCAGALLLAVYGSTLHFPFVFDDLDAIVHNASLRAPSLWAAWLPPQDTPVSGRPLVNLSFALNYRLGGQSLDPFGFRAVNLTLHAANGLLVFGLLLRLLARPVVPAALRARARRLSAWSAALWAVHPLQTEAVIYATQRTELLASTFVLLVIHCALGYLQEPDVAQRRRWLVLAAVSSGLGAGCKETLIAVPVVIAILDRCFYSASFRDMARTHRALYLALCVGLSPLFVQLFTQPRAGTAGLGLGISVWQALALSGRAAAWYLRLCFWPAPLSVSYNWSFQAGIARYWLVDLGVLCLLALTVWQLAAGKWFAAAGGWFFALLAPSTSLLPIISEPVAERRMYLPLVALSSLCVLGLGSKLARRPHLGTALCLLLTAASALRAHARAQDFASAERLFRAALSADPDNPQAMWGLAGALENRGQLDDALALYEHMAAGHYAYVGPASWGTRGLLAASQIYARRGERERAQATLQRALEHDPRSAISRLQRAAQLAASGQERAAIAALESMLDQPFLLERVQRELAVLYQRVGDNTHTARARQHFEAAEPRGPSRPASSQ